MMLAFPAAATIRLSSPIKATIESEAEVVTCMPTVSPGE